MKRYLGALAVLTALGAVPAQAADMPLYKAPPPAVFSWTGLYFGGDVGARWASVDTSVTGATLTTFGTPPINLLVPPSCASTGLFGLGIGPCPPSGTSFNSVSFRAGPYVGYNWQLNRQWVVGVEEDWAWASRSNTLNGAYYPGGNLSFAPGVADASFSIQETWDASLRARLGYLVTPDVLLYATGGASWIHLTATSTCPTDVGQSCSPGAAVPSVVTNSTNKLGWTIGGGLEAHAWGNWLVRGEYRYADYGNWANSDLRTFLLAATTLVVNYNVHVRTNTALFGLAYKM